MLTLIAGLKDSLETAFKMASGILIFFLAVRTFKLTSNFKSEFYTFLQLDKQAKLPHFFEPFHLVGMLLGNYFELYME